jgi:glycerophosphoryl diester phosphodiesterase
MREWLTARPIAHRGLHDAAAGAIENTATAFAAAVAHGYGIECDLQMSGDGEAMVYHDETLGRLTEGEGRLDQMPAAALKRVAFKETADRMLALGELCDLVAGRATLLLELKSRFNGDHRLARRSATVLAGYRGGPVAAMSFDPDPIAALRKFDPGLARGLVVQRRAERPSGGTRASAIGHARRALIAGPQFLAYRVQDLPSALPLFARHALGLPLLAWTVRTAQDRARATRYADQMIFEGFRP